MADPRGKNNEIILYKSCEIVYIINRSLKRILTCVEVNMEKLEQTVKAQLEQALRWIQEAEVGQQCDVSKYLSLVKRHVKQALIIEKEGI